MPVDRVVRGNLTKVIPTVLVGTGGDALPAAAMAKIEKVVVDSYLHLPDMFEITFFEEADIIGELSNLSIGAVVTIAATSPDGTAMELLMVGEVTAVEGLFADVDRTVVRGYSADHRLQRVRRTRTFVNMKKSDIARKIAGDAGLIVGTIDETKTAHDHVAQVNQTDWDFLSFHARSIGFEVGMVAGKFVFRDVGDRGWNSSAVDLTFPETLRSFAPRVTAGNIAAEAEVRIWDPVAARVATAKVGTESTSVRLNGVKPRDISAAFKATKAPPPPRRAGAAAGDLGPEPSDKGYVVSDWPLAGGSAADVAVAEAAKGLATHLGDTFAEADGEAIGDPRLLAGTVVDIAGVSDIFAGKWSITRARHVFGTGGYHTQFEVSGRQDRSLLGLASQGQRHRGTQSIPGVVCGVVTNNNDPSKRGRVKVALPWLSPVYESDWSCVIQAGAGKSAGTMFLPEVGDEVLVGFEFGDPQRAYVFGGVVNDRSEYRLGGEPVMVKGETGAVVWRGIVTPSGNRLAFHDEMPPGSGKGPPTASDLVLGTKDASLALAIDQVAGTVTLTCKPTPPDSKASAGQLTIECGAAGTINLKVGAGGAINIDGGAQLNLKAQAAVKIESQGIVEIKGSQIKLN